MKAFDCPRCGRKLTPWLLEFAATHHIGTTCDACFAHVQPPPRAGLVGMASGIVAGAACAIPFWSTWLLPSLIAMIVAHMLVSALVCRALTTHLIASD